MKIIENIFKTLVISILAFGFFVLPVHAKTYKITIAAGHPPIFPWIIVTRDYFLPEVDKRIIAAGGKDKIIWNQAYGGTIAKLGGVLEAVEIGIVDMGFVSTLFESPKMPLHSVSYMTPFGTSNIQTVVDTVADMQSAIPEMAQEWTKHNQIYLVGAAIDSYGLLTTFPIKTMEDLKGHKLAAPGPAANWIKGTGAVAVNANLNSFYNGMKTGVFEGALTFMTAANAIKIHEVAPYITLTNFGAQFAGGLSINTDIFNSFPKYIQEIIMEVSKETSIKLANIQTAVTQKALAAMEKNGATVYTLPESERVKWANVLPNVPMDWAGVMEKKKLPGKKIVSSYINGIVKDGTKLPRDWDK